MQMTLTSFIEYRIVSFVQRYDKIAPCLSVYTSKSYNYTKIDIATPPFPSS